MAGVTDLSFRRICSEMGAALTYTEMVSAKGLLYSPERSGTLLAGGSVLKPAAIQLFGNEPELLADMALQYAGDYEIIDINMGCPVTKVVKAGQGSALMNQPEWAGKIIETLVKRTGKPVTAKFRMGWDDHHINAVEFAQHMQDSGAAAVAVHGRTRQQFYTGKADWNIIGLVKRKLSIPVIGSGDIFTAENAMDLLESTGCDAVMVARGAQGNPWLFGQINALLGGQTVVHPQLAERLTVAKRHAVELCELKGERMAVQQMRKHLGWYIKGISQAAMWRDRLNGINTLDDMICLLHEIETAEH
jgi:tRNA-dihydrouridine synthase B